MTEFFQAAATFVNWIAQFFEIRIPYVGITFFEFLAAIIIIRVGLAVIRSIFGIDHSGDEA